MIKDGTLEAAGKGVILDTAGCDANTVDIQYTSYMLDLRDLLPFPPTQGSIMVVSVPPARNQVDWCESDSDNSSSTNTKATLNEPYNTKILLNNKSEVNVALDTKVFDAIAIDDLQ